MTDAQSPTIVATMISVGTVPVNIAPAATVGAGRAQVVVQPVGAAWVGLASNFTASAGLPIASGQLWTESRYSGDIFAQTAAATIGVNLRIYQG
jgi:hypothetical protein